MSAFAPVYRPRQHSQSLLTREQKREPQKRKRNEHEDDSDHSDAAIKSSPEPDDEPSPRAATTGAHPVNKTDPYFVAGLSREAELPPYPFPFAPIKSAEQPKLSAEEALAAVNPPLYVPKTVGDEHAASLKRKHLDNVTAILHQCMLRGDWQRASRAWGLLMRTETVGRGIDVRQHGRWTIGAEILVRRGQSDSTPRPIQERGDEDAQSERSDVLRSAGNTGSEWSDEGFKLAREYYERLILQYPHTPRTQHTLNATAFYPALLNTWVYGVQARYKRLRKEALERRPSTSDSNSTDDSTHRSDFTSISSPQDIRRAELEDAIPIAQRMDELLSTPPYDISLPLLQLRGMVGLWLADLYVAQIQARRNSDASVMTSPKSGPSSYADRVAAAQNRERSDDERSKALKLLRRVEAAGESVAVDQSSGAGVQDNMNV